MATRRLCLHYCEIFHMLQSNILYILHDSVLNSYKFLEKRSLVSPETLAPHKQRNNNNNNKTNRQTNRKASRQTNKRENNRIRETTYIAVEMTSLYNITLPYLVCNKLAGATSGSYVKQQNSKLFLTLLTSENRQLMIPLSALLSKLTNLNSD